MYKGSNKVVVVVVVTTKSLKKSQFKKNSRLHFYKKVKKQMVPCKSTAEEVSFEWSHHRISSTDSKVRTTLHVSMINSGSERVKMAYLKPNINTTRFTNSFYRIHCNQ